MSQVLSRLREATPITREEFAALEPQLRDALLHAQDDLAGRDFPVIVAIDGDDVTGCEDVFELLHAWFDARYLRAEAFAPPSDEERARPWLARYWAALPPRGAIGVWLRSWAGELVAARAADELDDDAFGRRIAELRRTEEALVADGALLVKLWIHAPKKSQKKRIEDAKASDVWRVSSGDELVLGRWDEFQSAAERVLDGTDGPHAPWLVIDGRKGRARSVAAARAIAELMRARLETTPSTRREAPPERATQDPVTILDRIAAPAPLDEHDAETAIERLQAKLNRLHREAHARGIPLVLVFEGQDAAGKGGAIRRVSRALDAPKYKVFPIAAPDERERSRHWLWRFWIRLPRDGNVAIFDRSWYGRVLVERVEGYATREAWRRAYGEIEDFEAQLLAHGACVAKFWLHVSAGEQLRRFEERDATSFKRYKIGPDDWRNRNRAHDYELAAAEMFARTSAAVPWHVIAADDKPGARIEVLRHTNAALRASLRIDDTDR